MTIFKNLVENKSMGTYVYMYIIFLLQTGEMEVKNPLFQDDPTPAQTPQVKPPPASDEKK